MLQFIFSIFNRNKFKTKKIIDNQKYFMKYDFAIIAMGILGCSLAIMVDSVFLLHVPISLFHYTIMIVGIYSVLSIGLSISTSLLLTPKYYEPDFTKSLDIDTTNKIIALHEETSEHLITGKFSWRTISNNYGENKLIIYLVDHTNTTVGINEEDIKNVTLLNKEEVHELPLDFFFSNSYLLKMENSTSIERAIPLKIIKTRNFANNFSKDFYYNTYELELFSETEEEQNVIENFLKIFNSPIEKEKAKTNKLNNFFN